MADPWAGFRTELDADVVKLDEQIEGLEDLTNANLSAEFTGLLGVALIDWKRRRDRIIALIATFDALVADGWPALPKVQISEALAEEREKQRRAFEAAWAIFETQLRATKIKVTLGEATTKAGT